jgi:hypothetical protein
MKHPIVINITNLIGTLVINGDSDNNQNEIEKQVLEALTNVLVKVQNLENQESHQDKILSQ